ncbi:clathrin adaptor complexe medium subunit [Capsaspora owczarzaki ATCC 30864]|uniref:Clathrin adaptor complexe medium subunit n=1 Tax=Capsaspora owczarzaki (strain ATCC 30864) TaxID=595528 RepID=A0A0D2X4W3_CAPO3|nr:clathrin adaptor complexe medium subunit [Capsaspora owczarzaki ATCC 30864]KJE96759.1 clathrin adaptor complexe medium subunit [Capsaspora owczarzaki ATCC 30864]|eukprot:XP_004343755.1 clathrin adaptor complexe medium subunit [Capsaspora owczarzaki ATCC 30864]
MLSQFFVLSARGDTLILKDYRGDVVRGTPEMFFRKLKSWPGGEAPPAFNIESIQFLYVKRNGLLFCCSTKFNVAPAFVLDFLNRVASVFTDYCGVLNEESLKRNFVLVYELLDEMLDFGYPQGSSTEMLKTFVYNTPIAVPADPTDMTLGSAGGVLGALSRAAVATSAEQVSRPATASNQPIAVSYDQARTRRNEVFVDLIEKLTVLVGSNGAVLRSDVDGMLKFKSFLSGSPTIRIGLNDDLVVKAHAGGDAGGRAGSVVLDDVNFHESVSLQKFEQDQTIAFVPTDGEVVLMNYRLTRELPLPFRITPFVEQVSGTRIDLVLKLRCEVPRNIAANQMVVRIPLPKSTNSCTFEIAHGVGQSAEYKANDKTAIWTLRRVNGSSEQVIRCKMFVPDASIVPALRREMGPISMTFEIPMHICSGLQIRYLRVFEKTSSYAPSFRWVRVVTQSDSYVVRI